MLFIAEEKTGEKSFTAFSFTEYEVRCMELYFLNFQLPSS